jgi:hypothetical protein
MPIERTFDILARLSRFKPTRINFCSCSVSHKGNSKPMKYHFIRKCLFCNGKIVPEHWMYAKDHLRKLKVFYHD